MDDTADAMHIVKAQKELASEAAHDGNWDAAVVVLFDQAQQVLAKHLHCHCVMFSVQGVVKELIEHLQIVRVISGSLELRVLKVCTQEVGPLRVLEILRNFVKYFFLLER